MSRPSSPQTIKGLLALTAAVALASSLAVFASAQTAPSAATSSADGLVRARVVTEGRVLRDQVQARTGASENYYVAARLPLGSTVTITGKKFSWLRIVPPEGSFSLVAKQFIDLDPSGKTGRVRGTRVNVRAGSPFGPQASTVQTQLVRGDTVTVLGEVENAELGTLLKIAPPPGAYLFVHEDLVEPVRPVTAGNFPEPRLSGTEAAATGTGATTGGTLVGAGTTRPAATRPALANDAGIYGGGVAGDSALTGVGPTGIPGTRPAGPDTSDLPPAQTARLTAAERAEAAFAEAEALWAAAKDLPIEDQPLPDLIARYDALAANDDLAITLRQQARTTAAFLKVRNQSRDELIDLRNRRAEMQARLSPLQQEGQSIQSRIRQVEATSFTAVGQLQTSALQEAGQPLLRLIDPANNLTLVYLRTTDTSLVGTFVGVRGPIATDTNLNIQVITPNTVVRLDPSSIGRGVNADIIPGSLRHQLPAATPPSNPPATNPPATPPAANP